MTRGPRHGANRGVARRVPDDYLPIHEALIRTLFVPDVKSAGPRFQARKPISPTTEFIEVCERNPGWVAADQGA